MSVVLFRAALGGCRAFRKMDEAGNLTDANPGGAAARVVFRRARETARRSNAAPGYGAVCAWGRVDVARWLRAHGVDDVGPFVARARVYDGPDLLRLDDETLERVGVASKLRRRAMLASLDIFRGGPPPPSNRADFEDADAAGGRAESLGPDFATYFKRATRRHSDAANK